MNWLKRLITGGAEYKEPKEQQAPTPHEGQLTHEEEQRHSPSSNDAPALLAFPAAILKKANKIATTLTLANITQELVQLSNQWERGIPYCLAAFTKTTSHDFLGLLAMCCHHAAIEQCNKNAITKDGEAYINCAIAGLSFLIDENNGTREIFAARGSMYMVKAQLDGDLSLLDKAHVDCRKAALARGSAGEREILGSPSLFEIADTISKIDYLRKNNMRTEI